MQFEICHAQIYLILYSINFMTISQQQVDNVLTVSIGLTCWAWPYFLLYFWIELMPIKIILLFIFTNTD